MTLPDETKLCDFINRFITGFLLVCLLVQVNQANAQSKDLKLWYNKPAAAWTDALPIGNGRLGAMVFGGIRQEHIQFNEQTLWTGKPRDYQRNDAHEYLDTIRQLLFQGKQKEAESLAQSSFMGLKDIDDSSYERQKNNWLQQLSVRKNIPVVNDGLQWKQIALPTPNGWEAEVLPGLDGSVWLSTSFDVPATLKGEDLYIDLGRIRDVDITYINGRKIGSSEGISTKRHYKIPSSVLKPGKNTISVQVIHFFDKGGFTGVKSGKVFVLYAVNKPVADTINLSSSWSYYIENTNPPAFPQYQASYQPFGDVFFNLHHKDSITSYKRELDISTAVSSVSYTTGGVDYQRTFFSSYADQVIAVHFTASKPGSISMEAFFKTLHQQYIVKKIDANTLALHIQVRNGALIGIGHLRIKNKNGLLRISGGKVNLEKADEVTFYLSAATNFVDYKNTNGDAEKRSSKVLERIAKKTYVDMLAAHIKDYQQMFNRFSVRLGDGKDGHAALPTDQRILQYKNGNDPGLLALYMQYGRYLLISSSRKPTGDFAPLPASLQGIWNDNLTPSWGSKYTTNINLQMNYWPADLLNLSGCNQPLFSMIKQLETSGKKTAKAHYNADGWVLHHNTDIWLGTAPINASNHGIWVTGAAWLAQHVWQHYLFTGDTLFLKNNYSVLKNAAVFFTQFLIPDPKTGFLISTPSNSPEHGGLVAGPTMDHQIIRELFKNCISASAILEDDAGFRYILKRKYDSIAPNTIGDFGELREWMTQQEDTTEQHRHVSHLWGVYPGTDITWKDSAMMKAARQSLLYRGDGGTGWSLAWKLNLWARFGDGNHCMEIINNLLSPADNGVSEKGGVYRNLFDAHPPFQIDGNFGGAAGMAEMIVQSQDDEIVLLPALPHVLPDGEMNGLLARGGFQLDVNWKNGRLAEVKILSKKGGRCVLRYGSVQKILTTTAGNTFRINGMLDAL